MKITSRDDVAAKGLFMLNGIKTLCYSNNFSPLGLTEIFDKSYVFIELGDCLPEITREKRAGAGYREC